MYKTMEASIVTLITSCWSEARWGKIRPINGPG